MEYSITLSEDRQYIMLQVIGDITAERAMKCNIEAHTLGKKLGIKRYFSDVTQARNVDSIINNYDFAYKDMRTTEGIDIYAQVAVLVSVDDHSHDFIETVALNAGLNMKIFRDKAAAMKFLLA